MWQEKVFCPNTIRMDRVTGPLALRRCCSLHSTHSLTSLCRAGGAPTYRSTHTPLLLTSIQLDSASLSEDDRDYCGGIHEPNLHQQRRVEPEPRRERERVSHLSLVSPHHLPQSSGQQTDSWRHSDFCWNLALTHKHSSAFSSQDACRRGIVEVISHKDFFFWSVFTEDG